MARDIPLGNGNLLVNFDKDYHASPALLNRKSGCTATMWTPSAGG